MLLERDFVVPIKMHALLRHAQQSKKKLSTSKKGLSVQQRSAF